MLRRGARKIMRVSLTFWMEVAQDDNCATDHAGGDRGHALLKTTVRGVAISVSGPEATLHELPRPLSLPAAPAATENSDCLSATTSLPEVDVRLYQSSRVFRKDLRRR